MEGRGWPELSVGDGAIFHDGDGNIVEGFVEVADSALEVAWIRVGSSGERRMISREEFRLARIR